MKHLRNPRIVVPVVVVLLLMVGSRLLFKVPLPHIQLAPEPLGYVGPVPFTNTMLALILADLLLLGIVFVGVRRMEMMPGRLQNFLETIYEFWETQSRQLLGERATRSWLPLVLTIFLLVWFANYSHFIPGFDSIGVLCRGGSCPGEDRLPAGEEPRHTYFDVAWTGGAEGEGIGLIKWRSEEGPSGWLQKRLAGGEPAEGGHEEAAAGSEGSPEGAAGSAGSSGDGAASDAEGAGTQGSGAESAAAEDAAHGYSMVPYLRVPASDLNLTIAIALIAFLAIEIAGLRAFGARYLTKFVHVDFSKGLFQGVLNLFVGVIEAISEVSRIISFSFRLFGNIFAGQVLLFIFPFLAPLLLVLPFYGLEVFVGLIQAYVFAILTLAFLSLALAPPHGDEHH